MNYLLDRTSIPFLGLCQLYLTLGREVGNFPLWRLFLSITSIPSITLHTHCAHVRWSPILWTSLWCNAFSRYPWISRVTTTSQKAAGIYTYISLHSMSACRPYGLPFPDILACGSQYVNASTRMPYLNVQMTFSASLLALLLEIPCSSSTTRCQLYHSTCLSPLISLLLNRRPFPLSQCCVTARQVREQPA